MVEEVEICLSLFETRFIDRCGLTNDIYLLRGGAVLKLSGDELVLLAE